MEYPTPKLWVKIKNTIFQKKKFIFYNNSLRSHDREKLLKFEAEGLEFIKILRSPEQFVQTVKAQNNFW